MATIKTKLLILLYGVMSLCIVLSLDKLEDHNIITYDISGYYLYLPATIIYKDLGHLSFYPHVDSMYHPTEQKWYEIRDVHETGKRINKYPAGVALFELPFFLAAHAYTLITHQYPADGYSLPYEIGVCVATIFWCMIGLYLLRRLLLRFYSERVAFFTILLIALGTNLYDYTAYEFGMSHTFSFFLFAAFLHCMCCWFDSGKGKYLVWMGLLTGWMLITRPTNVLILLVPLLWQDGRYKKLSDKLKPLGSNVQALEAAVVLCAAMLMVLLGYWKYVTGHWIYYSYEQEGFSFLQPHLMDGLFSYRKGWLLYTPMAAVAMPGFVFLYKTRRQLVLPLLSFVLLNVYIVYSWHAWSYGGSFGSRPMVDSLPLLAIPLAAFVEWLIAQKREVVKVGLSVLLALLVALNMFQTFQFMRGDILQDEMTKEHYWQHFFDVTDV